MIESPKPRARTLSLGEEIANSVSHGVGLLAAMAAAPILVIGAVQRETVTGVVGAGVFATTMVLVYLMSTLYHASSRSRAKQFLNALDRGAIYLLIAGTYTPFTLGVLRGAWGWTLFGLVWALALAGIVLMAVRGLRHPKIAMCLYVAMGWLAIIAVKPLCVAMPTWGLFWLVVGGIAYTAGLAFYRAKEIRYTHFIWHLFVIAGTSCHFIAVVRYAG